MLGSYIPNAILIYEILRHSPTAFGPETELLAIDFFFARLVFFINGEDSSESSTSSIKVMDDLYMLHLLVFDVNVEPTAHAIAQVKALGNAQRNVESSVRLLSFKLIWSNCGSGARL